MELDLAVEIGRVPGYRAWREKGNDAHPLPPSKKNSCRALDFGFWYTEIIRHIE